MTFIYILDSKFWGDGVRGLVYSLSMLTIFVAPSIFESHNSISTNVVWPWGLEMDGCAAIEFLDYLFFLRNKMNMCFYHQDGLQEINSEILHSGLKCHNKWIIGHAYVWLYNVLNVFFSNRVAIFFKFFNVDFCALGAYIKLHFFQITALLWDTIQCRQLWTRTQHFSVGTISTDHWRNLYFLCLYLCMYFLRERILYIKC